MVFPIAGGTQDTSYEIENSLRFNDDDGAYLQRTAGANTGEDNATLSFWFKLGNIKSDNNGGTIMTEGGTTGNHIMQIYANKIYIGSGAFGIMFPNLIRDPSAWYHLFIAFDTSQSTNTNRVKAYLNGVLLTDATGFTDYPDQNENLGLCVNGNTTRIGSRGNSGASAFDGYLAEFHFLDGTTKAYTDFGEFNDNGVWIPKKYTGGSYGDNGFYLEFKQTGTGTNSSGMGADTSGNDNHLAVNNLAAIDVTTDTPTNNFCTLNPLSAKTLTFSEGNLHATNDGAAGSATGTIAPTNGKWYFEITLSGSANFAAGVVNLDDWPSGTDIYNYGAAAAVSIENNANYNITYGNTAASPSTLQTGTQLLNAKYGFAMDIDNNDLYVSANGNWYTGSAFDNTSFSSASAVTTDLPSNVPLTAFIRNPDTGSARCNFGNPAGADTISSGNADANGYGNFEYAVPSGYYSLCTKNLAEFG